MGEGKGNWLLSGGNVRDMSISLASYLKVVLCMLHFYTCIKSWDTDSMVCSRLWPSLVLNFAHPILVVYLKYLAMILLPESKGALRVCPFLCTFFISVCIACFTCLFAACHNFADGFQGRNPELCKSNFAKLIHIQIRRFLQKNQSLTISHGKERTRLEVGPLAGMCCVENPVVDFEEIVRLGSSGGNVTRRSSNGLSTTQLGWYSGRDRHYQSKPPKVIPAYRKFQHEVLDGAPTFPNQNPSPM